MDNDFLLVNDTDLAEMRKQFLDMQKQLKIHGYYMNNTKMMNYITTHNVRYNEYIPISNTAYGDGEDTRVCLKTVTGMPGPQISMFDRTVMDAIYTLLRNGYPFASVQTITKVVYGSLEKKAKDSQKKAVKESLERLQQICVCLDCENELTRRGVIHDQGFDEETGEEFRIAFGKQLMYNDATDVISVNGRKVTVYFLNRNVLYLYAEKVHQIISIPWELRDVSHFPEEYVPDSDGKCVGILIKQVDKDTIVIRDYLIRRIEVMKNADNNMSVRKISYEWYDKNAEERKGMFSELGYERENYSNWRKKRNLLNGRVQALFKYYAAIGYIDSAEQTGKKNRKDGHTRVAGWDIEL